jgi:tol-pal system protein YbgF
MKAAGPRTEGMTSDYPSKTVKSLNERRAGEGELPAQRAHLREKPIRKGLALPSHQESQAMKLRTSRFFLPVVALVFVLLSSCVYDEEFAYLNDQVSALNKRVGSLEDSLNNNLNPVRSSQAGFQSDLDELRGEVRSLSGRVEENEHVIKGTVEKDLGAEDALRSNVAQLSERVAALETMVQQQQQYLGLEAPAAKKEEGQLAPGAIKGAMPKVSPVPAQAPAASKEVDLYDKSLALYRDGKYEKAIDGFKEFLKTHPKSDRADNAQFWIGESYMALKQYEQAILAYQEVIKKYPKGNKAANATLRQAMAFLEINDKTSAKLLLGKVMKNYPGSNEAKIARKKLDTLK